MQKIIYSLTWALSLFILTNQSIYAQKSPDPGDLIITEFMVNPAAVSDTKGEWIELYNPGEVDILINGLILKDLGSNSHQIEPEEELLVPAGGYLLLGRNAEPSENGGIQPDYVYNNFSLGNSEDEIYLQTAEGILLDGLSYNGDWAINAGVSLELDPAFHDTTSNNDPGHWYLASTVYGAGDLGTPGQQNTALAKWDLTIKPAGLEAYPNPCQNELNVKINSLPGQHSIIYMVNVLGQKYLCYSDPTGQQKNIQLNLSTFSKGIYWLEYQSGEQRELCTIIKN